MKENKTDRTPEKKESNAGEFGAKLVIFLIAAGSAVGAILCFRAGFAPGKLAEKIGWDIGGAVLAILSCLSFLILVAALSSRRRNLFLYDRATKTNIAVEQLTWEKVDRTLEYCFAYYFSTDRRAATMPEILRPLFMVYFLLRMPEGKDDDLDRFLSGDKAMVDNTVFALNAIGLEEEGRRVMYHYGAYRGDSGPFRMFLETVTPTLQNKILEYVKTNIDSF